MMASSRRFGVALAVLVGGGCGEASREHFEATLAPPVVLVSLESELIGYAAGMALDARGVLWIADSQNRRVAAFDEEGGVVQMFGRQGSGPGEFELPVSVAVNDTVVRVLDSRLRRVQDFRPDGMHIADHAVVICGSTQPLLADERRVISTTLGTDSALAVVREVGESEGMRLGTPVAPTPRVFVMSAIKETIARSEVPAELRNNALAASGADGATWLALLTEAEVQKFAADGALLWNRVLEVPEVEIARREFFRANAEETNPMRIVSLRTVLALRAVGDDLWVLMRGETAEQAVFYVLDGATGETRGIVRIQTPAVPGEFLVDRTRGRLILSIPAEATILTYDIGDVEWPGG